MPSAFDVLPAHANAREDGDALVIKVGGRWRITGERMDWRAVVGSRIPKAVRLEAAELTSWDSSLVLFWQNVRRWCAEKGIGLEDRGLPEQARKLLEQLEATKLKAPVEDGGAPGLFTAVGLCVGS